jgi:DNA-binding LacI/PurR family transcriptional regulator
MLSLQVVVDLRQHVEANFVVWGPPLADQRYVSVGSDGVSGAAQAVRHLVQLGRCRIGFIGGDEDETETWLRRQGYEQGLREAGLPVDEDLITSTHFTSESGYLAMCRLLAQAPDLDGVFACSERNMIEN